MPLGKHSSALWKKQSPSNDQRNGLKAAFEAKIVLQLLPGILGSEQKQSFFTILIRNLPLQFDLQGRSSYSLGQVKQYQSEESWLMNILKSTGVFLTAILTTLALSTEAWAGKGGNGQTGNGGGGGGNDTPDPDYAILAIGSVAPAFAADSNCCAFNPDLKGPGIAYGGFYENTGYVTCAHAVTSDDAIIDLRSLDIQLNSSGEFSTIQLRGRNPLTGVVYESRAKLINITGQKPPTDGSGFTLQVRTTIPMFSCGTAKLKGNTVCDDGVGTITIEDLKYEPLQANPYCLN